MVLFDFLPPPQRPGKPANGTNPAPKPRAIHLPVYQPGGWADHPFSSEIPETIPQKAGAPGLDSETWDTTILRHRASRQSSFAQDLSSPRSPLHLANHSFHSKKTPHFCMQFHPFGAYSYQGYLPPIRGPGRNSSLQSIPFLLRLNRKMLPPWGVRFGVCSPHSQREIFHKGGIGDPLRESGLIFLSEGG